MVRTLSAPLTTALNSITHIPAISATAEDHVQHFTSFQAPGGADAYNDACIATDGSLVRVQVTRGGSGLVSNFQFQRITNTATAAQWTSWTTFTGGSANCFQDGSCAISNNGGTLNAFVQRGTGGQNLWVWSSTNNGVSWTGPVSILTPPANALIKGIASAGNNDVFFIYDVVGGETIGASFFSGTWGAQKTYGTIIGQGGAGLASIFASSVYTLIVSDSFSLQRVTYDAVHNTWTGNGYIEPATTSAIGRVSPRVFFDSNTSLYNLVCVDFDGGLLTGLTYNYPRIRQSADLIHWSTGTILHAITCEYGAVMVNASTNTETLIISMPSVYRNPIYSGSATQLLDISSIILSYIRSEQINTPAKLVIELDNNRGAISSKIGTNTSFQPINLNNSIILNEGYKTGSPPTTATTIKVGNYHINQIHFLRSPQENKIQLICYDKSRNLDNKNRYQVIYTNQTLSYLITEITAKSGLFSISLPATTQMSEPITSFALQANQTFRTALNSLCSTYSLEYFMDQTETIIFKELSSGDTSVWTYQPEVERVSFGADDERGNHIIVTGRPPIGGSFGAITVGEAYDDTNTALVGLERLIQQVDIKLTTNAQCTLKAGFILSQEQRNQVAQQVIVPANPALQLIDVLTLNDYATPSGSGQAGNARIEKQQVHYDAQKAEFMQTIDLEGV